MLKGDLLFKLLNILGHFYYKYPRHGQLISINKRHTGKLNDEFNMRHDWNSLLTEILSSQTTLTFVYPSKVVIS